MSLQARTKNIEKVLGEVGDAFEEMVEAVEMQQEFSFRLQTRVASMEEELRILKREADTTN